MCLYSVYKQKGVQEPVKDCFPESSRTSLSSVWFAGTTPENWVPKINLLRLPGLKTFISSYRAQTRRVSEGVSERVSEGVSEGLLKGS